MAVTVELDAGGIRVVDTSAGPAVWGPSLVKSVTVVEHRISKSTLATAGTLTVDFGSIAAAKVLAVKVSAGPVTLTMTVNGVASGNIRVNDTFILIDTGGGITACAITQSTGSDVTVDILLAGST